MASSDSKKAMYPQVVDSHPDVNSPFLASAASSSSSVNLYPEIDTTVLAENLFPDIHAEAETVQPAPIRDTLLRVPGAILHLIDADQSVELATGEFTLTRLRQGDHSVAILACLGDVHWPLTRDAASVKLDQSHYFFTLRLPPDPDHPETEDHGVVNYGLTFPAKGEESLLKELDKLLKKYSSFSVQKVQKKSKERAEVLEVVEVTPAEAAGEKKEVVEQRSAAYWTTLAPNVEDYSSGLARLVAMGSGQLVKGILWTGDVTADRLKWGEEFLKKRISHHDKPKEISPGALRRMKRIKKMTEMTDSVAQAVLSGVLSVTGFFAGSIVNSPLGKKFFSLMPGEVILASLDGFVKICDAAELAGKNVLSTSSVVTTEVVSHRYGDEAGELTHDYLHATGHVLGTAWTVFKLRKALNPKEAMKSKRLVKTTAVAAANEMKGKHQSEQKTK